MATKTKDAGVVEQLALPGMGRSYWGWVDYRCGEVGRSASNAASKRELREHLASCPFWQKATGKKGTPR